MRIRSVAVVLVSTLTVAGCKGLKDALTAHTDVAAEAADLELSATRLGSLLGNARIGIESMLVRPDEARITFRETAVPRMKGLSAAFHDVQFQAEVRRAIPLSLKLTRLGGAPMLEGLVRALRSLV